VADKLDAELIAEMMNNNLEDRRSKLYPVLPPTGGGTRLLPYMPRDRMTLAGEQATARDALASNGYAAYPQPTRPLPKEMTDAMMYALRPDLEQFKHTPPARVSLARLQAEMDEQERSLGVGRDGSQPRSELRIPGIDD
jgi:hypothetical protein